MHLQNRYGLFVYVKPHDIVGLAFKGNWRFEGFIDDPDRWLKTERRFVEQDNGPGSYILVALPNEPAPRDDDEAGDEIKTRVYVSLERAGNETPATGYMFEYEQSLDRNLASDISMDVGEWLEENA